MSVSEMEKRSLKAGVCKVRFIAERFFNISIVQNEVEMNVKK